MSGTIIELSLRGNAARLTLPRHVWFSFGFPPSDHYLRPLRNSANLEKELWNKKLVRALAMNMRTNIIYIQYTLEGFGPKLPPSFFGERLIGHRLSGLPRWLPTGPTSCIVWQQDWPCVTCAWELHCTLGIGLSPILSFFLDHLVLRIALDLSGSAVADNGALFTGSAVADNRGSIQQFFLSCTGRKLLYLQFSFCCVLNWLCPGTVQLDLILLFTFCLVLNWFRPGTVRCNWFLIYVLIFAAFPSDYRRLGSHSKLQSKPEPRKRRHAAWGKRRAVPGFYTARGWCDVNFYKDHQAENGDGTVAVAVRKLPSNQQEKYRKVL